MLMLMFYAPLLQYLADKFPWSNTKLLANDRIIYSNLLMLIFTLLFEIAYRITNAVNETGDHKMGVNMFIGISVIYSDQ